MSQPNKSTPQKLGPKQGGQGQAPTQTKEADNSASDSEAPAQKPAGGRKPQQSQALQQQQAPPQPQAQDENTLQKQNAALQQQLQVLQAQTATPAPGGQRIAPVRQSRIVDRPPKTGEKDSSLKIKVELDLEVEVDLYARVKGDVTIGLM